MSAQSPTATKASESSSQRSGIAAFSLGLLKAHVVLLTTIALLVLAYTLAGFFLVPRIARSQIESYVTDTLHQKIAIGEVRFNPFALDTSIDGLALREQDGGPLVGFRHLYVNAELASLWRRAIVLSEVALSGPTIHLEVAPDGSVNLAQLVPPSDPAEEAAAEEPLPRVHIGRFAVREGRIDLIDRARAQPFAAAVEPIRFTLSDFKTDVGYRNAYRFAGTTDSGEELEWSGGFTVQPFGSTGQFSVQHLKLATINSYLRESLPFALTAGEALLKGGYAFALDPLTLDVNLPLVAVRNMALTERGPNAATPVRIPEFDVQHLTFSYGKGTIEAKRIDVREAHIDVAREADGTISINRLFGGAPAAAADASSAQTGTPPAASPQAPESASEDESTFSARVESLHIENASIVAEDRAVTPLAHFEFAPANLTVSGWSTQPDARFDVDADIAVNKEGRLKLKGSMQLEPRSAEMALDLSDVSLLPGHPYFAPYASLTVHSGTLSAKGDISFASSDAVPAIVKFAGDIRVADLRTTDHFLNKDFLKWSDLSLTGVKYEPDGLAIDKIVARKPYASVIVGPDATLNIAKIMQPQTPAAEGVAPQKDTKPAQDAKPAPAATSDAEAAFPVAIRLVQIIDGSANFADLSIQPSFATAIVELNGKVTGLSSDEASRAQVALEGKVDKYAPVDINGEVNLFAVTKYTALAMNFRNMELTTFNPYSGKFAGYNISRGKLSTELKYRIEDRKLVADHHIVVDNLEFGAKTESKDAAPIPIKLAVALLKDRKGIIDVQLPVTGTVDDPKFRLGPIIWKAILGLLTKIATAPFAAIGALFGGGDELAYVDFPVGSAQLSAGDKEKLDKVARALVERPQLKLNVPLTVTSAQDADALAQRALQAQLPPETPAQPADEGEKRKRVKALEGAYQTVLKTKPEYPEELKGRDAAALDGQMHWLEEALLADLRPGPDAVEALARERARAVQDVLLANTELSPERVFITNERNEGKSEGDAVRMEMKLE